MSYKIFLLERELGYQINKNTNGLIVIQRLKMLDRYWLELEKENKKSKKTKRLK